MINKSFLNRTEKIEWVRSRLRNGKNSLNWLYYLPDNIKQPSLANNRFGHLYHLINITTSTLHQSYYNKKLTKHRNFFLDFYGGKCFDNVFPNRKNSIFSWNPFFKLKNSATHPLYTVAWNTVLKSVLITQEQSCKKGPENN